MIVWGVFHYPLLGARRFYGARLEEVRAKADCEEFKTLFTHTRWGVWSVEPMSCVNEEEASKLLVAADREALERKDAHVIAWRQSNLEEACARS